MKIKERPEDFVVKEKLELPLGEGPYAYFMLRKKQWNTSDAVRAIADKLDIPEKDISYAGLKDRQAITEQHISILDGRKDHENIKLKDIELKYLGQGPERIHTGQLEGNSFEITVREAKDAEPKSAMPNYFDEQRFGMNNTNALIGKALVQKDFKKACETLNLEADGNNYIGALQKHGRILKLYLHSYQSRLFNQILSEHIKKQYRHKEIECGYDKLAFPLEDMKDKIKIPLISFDMESEGELKEIIRRILDREGINLKDFIIRPLPELVAQTEYREGFVRIDNLKIEDLDSSTKKVTFELQKGSYATVALKAIFLQNP